MWHPSLPYGELVVRALVTYVVVLALLRLGGKKQVGQMGSAEFVALILISNAVQNSMNGGDNSLTGGVVLAVVLIAASWLVTYATYRWRRAEALIEGRPTILVYRGETVDKNLAKERVAPRELRTLLRRQGVHEVAEVHEAVLESNGMVTIVRKSEVPFAYPPGGAPGNPS
ncbi:MAG: DUF421 domain-containing protein [Elusimicrobia bacterium]|nr:DUF421 domain-containing protein [Elusimicrobiota bacterium]